MIFLIIAAVFAMWEIDTTIGSEAYDRAAKIDIGATEEALRQAAGAPSYLSMEPSDHCLASKGIKETAYTEPLHSEPQSDFIRNFSRQKRR